MVPEIKFTTYIAARPEKVWTAVSSQEHVRRWLSSATEWEPRLGGQVRMFGQDDKGTRFVMGGEMRVWDPPHRLEFVWAGLEPEPHPETYLEITLEPEGEGTRVTLRHYGFADVPLFESYQEGWGNPQKMFAKLAAVVQEAA